MIPKERKKTLTSQKQVNSIEDFHWLEWLRFGLFGFIFIAIDIILKVKYPEIEVWEIVIEADE